MTYRRGFGTAFGTSRGSAGIPPSRLDSLTMENGTGKAWTHAGLATALCVIQSGTTPSQVLAHDGTSTSVGVLSYWLSSVSAQVQRSGLTPALFTGLTVGTTYYAASGGGVSTAGTQVIGVAHSDTQLWLTIPECAAAIGSVTNLDGLTDVVVSSVADGNILRYSASGSAFVNTALAPDVEIVIPVAQDTVQLVPWVGSLPFCVGASLNGYDIVGVVATVGTAGTTGTTDVQIRRRRGTSGSGSDADVLSTVCTIDSGERSSVTAAVSAVVNTANDDLQTGDFLYVDVDAVAETAPYGLSVAIQCRKA